MKAEGLMVGDLLTFKDCVGDSGFPILKVNGILPDSLFVRIDYSDADDEVDYEDIIGIPITPEILEKNGFKYTNNHTLKGADTYVLRHEQNGFDYTITIKLNDWFAVDSFDDRTYRIFEMETGRWHVHELQHALRLCGIEKEIVI